MRAPIKCLQPRQRFVLRLYVVELYSLRSTMIIAHGRLARVQATVRVRYVAQPTNDAPRIIQPASNLHALFIMVRRQCVLLRSEVDFGNGVVALTLRPECLSDLRVHPCHRGLLFLGQRRCQRLSLRVQVVQRVRPLRRQTPMYQLGRCWTKLLLKAAVWRQWCGE